MKVRIYTYTSFRHYGGRAITTCPHKCEAKFIKEQSDNTYLVELLEDCANFKIGYKIAVLERDFNI